MTLLKEDDSRFARSLILLASSFLLAFCLQVTVHELGHYLTGLLIGAQGFPQNAATNGQNCSGRCSRNGPHPG